MVDICCFIVVVVAARLDQRRDHGDGAGRQGEVHVRARHDRRSVYRIFPLISCCMCKCVIGEEIDFRFVKTLLKKVKSTRVDNRYIFNHTFVPENSRNRVRYH